MPTAEHVPAPDRFVVRPATQMPERADLEPVGTLGAAAPDLVVLRVRQPARDPKETWRRILGGAPQMAWAAPVLVDEDGEEHFRPAT